MTSHIRKERINTMINTVDQSDYQKLHEWLNTCPVSIYEYKDFTDLIQVIFAIELEPDEEDE